MNNLILKMSSKQSKIWKKSKIKRELLSIGDCISTAIKIKIISSQRKDRFKWFVHYLIEKSSFLPIYQKETESEGTEIKHFFHPLQFLEIINIYLQIFRKKVYYSEDEKFERYIFTKEKLHKLKELTSEMEKKDSYEFLYIPNYEETLSQFVKEWEDKEFQLIHQYSSNVLTDIKRIKNSSFNQEHLTTWMKMEELFPNIQCLTRMVYNDQDSKKSYEIWRNKTNKQQYFSNEELSHLEAFLTYFRETTSSFSNNIEKISDILEYCPWNDFNDILWYSSQLIMLERGLVRVLYIVTGNNYSSSNRVIEGKPDYYHEDEKSLKDWRTSVLIHRNLLTMPLKIIVEGKTESDLLSEYKKVHWQDKWVDIIKEGGIDETQHYERTFTSLDFNYYWYLFDYDDGQHKEKFLNIKNKTWFFPDFVTEIFTEEQVLGAYKDVIASMGLDFKQIFCEEKILGDLNDIKKKSNKMIEEYPDIQLTCKGYEDYLTELSFDKIEIRRRFFFGFNKFQTSYKDLNNKLKKSLRNKFKKEYGKFLLGYFIKFEEKRAIRNEIFDKKMEVAFSFFNSITNRKFESFLNH